MTASIFGVGLVSPPTKCHGAGSLLHALGNSPYEGQEPVCSDGRRRHEVLVLTFAEEAVTVLPRLEDKFAGKCESHLTSRRPSFLSRSNLCL